MSASEYPSEITVKQGTDGKWSCPIENCSHSKESFSSMIKDHYRAHFKHLNWVNCKHCVLSQSRLGNMKKHLASRHGVQKAEEGKDYEENKELLAKETRLIESASKIISEADELDLPFKCDQCSKQFLRDPQLEVHKMREHLQGKKYECVYCNFAAVTKEETYKHSVRAHLFFEFTSYRAATPEQKSKLDQCYRVKIDKSSTAKPKTKSFFTAKPVDFKKAKQVERKFKAQVSKAKPNTAKVKGKANKLLRCFTYFLLDPRLVPEEEDFAFSPEKFLQFVAALFYVGLGTSLNRPYVHERKDGEHKKCDKIDEINKDGYNITVFPFFSGLSPAEGSAREAILISTLGLDCLTNEVAGHLPKEVQLELEEIHLLGNYWLYRAYRAFAYVGIERPFLEDDEWQSGNSSDNHSHHKSSKNHGSAAVEIDSGEKEYKKRKIESKTVDKSGSSDR